MKKIFALALAAVMTAGMTTVAFAAPEETGIGFYHDGGYVVYYDGAGANGDKDGKIEAYESVVLGAVGTLAGGTTVYFPLYNYHPSVAAMVTDEDDVKGWRVTDTIKDVKAELTTVKIDGVWTQAVAMTVPETGALDLKDLEGSIILYGTGSAYDKDSANDTTNYRKITPGLEYGYEAVDFATAESNGFDKAELVSFKGEEEVEMEFGDEFLFAVDVTGQSKLNLKNNTDFNKEFAAMYDYANIDFINFEYEPSFNKIGTAYIYADEDAFIYEVTAAGAKEIAGLKWDEDYDAWSFKTRTLKSYAISDVELDEKTVTEDNTSSTTDGGKENPDTGR